MRFTAEEADRYGTASTNYFTLKNNKDTARVRIMYRDTSDIEGMAVHQVEIGDGKRYVNCLRDYSQSMDNCPLCKAGYRVIPKIFVPMYDVETDDVKIWERGKSFIGKLSSLCARYNPLVSHIVEIERNGEKGDMKTTYEIYDISKDDTTLEDLPEIPDVLGTMVLDKSYADMEEYLNTGAFPEGGAVTTDSTSDTGRNSVRNSRVTRTASSSDARPTGRRTPMNNRY